MKVIACLLALIPIMMTGSAVAQTKTKNVSHNFTIKQGATVPIGTYYLINKRNCHAGPLPQIVQTSNPTIGKLIIEQTPETMQGFFDPGLRGSLPSRQQAR